MNDHAAGASPVDRTVRPGSEARPLLERLREGTFYGTQALMDEAAREIEKLRDDAATFHATYRMKCDKETKEQAAEIERLRGERAVLLRWMGSALAVLATLEGEDSEDGGEELSMLLTTGKRLMCAHPNKQTKHFTYGMRSHCPDCGHSEEAWWD